MSDKITVVGVRGSAALRVPPLPSPDASTSLHLDVAAWAGKPARLSRMDRLCAISLASADAALLRAGLSPEAPDWPAERCGVVVGTAYGCYATNEAYDLGSRTGTPSPRLFAYTLPSSAAGEISIHARLLGPVSTVVSGLTAGLDALREAARHLDAGRADRMLVVGADVVAPILGRLRDGVVPTHDVACALVLERGVRVHGATRFHADDPEGAARECLAIVGGVEVIDRLDDTYLAAAPLVALRERLAAGAHDVTIVTSDPIGQATAVRLTFTG